MVCAVGRSKEIFRWNILKRVVGFCFIFIGMQWGVEGILYGMVCSIYFTFLINAYVATSTTGYTILNQLKDAFPILCLSIISGIICYAISYIEGLNNNAMTLLIQNLTFIFIYLSISKLTNRFEFLEYYKIITSYLNKKK